MKKILYCILTTAIALLSFTSCNTNDTAWQKDCGVFIQTLTDLAPKAFGEDDKYGKKFKNKKVEWKLTFKEISKNKDGEDELQFDLEPFGLKHVFFSGKPVMMGGFKPAAGTLEIWKTTTPGSQVKISAVITSVLFAKMGPSSNPDSQVPVAFASVEDVKIVQD